MSEPTATVPEPWAAASVGDPVSGRGPTEPFPGVAFPIFEGSRSVVVELECVGGGPFSVELGDSMMLGQAPLSGMCDGTSRLAWPITERTGSTLYVRVGDGVDWTATPTFSAEEFVYDAAITVDCEGFSEVYSALWNADSGLALQAIDEAEWSERVDQATADLRALATSAQSELGAAFAELHVVVTDPGRTVGMILNDATVPSIDTITVACNANHTPVITTAEFGG